MADELRGKDAVQMLVAKTVRETKNAVGTVGKGTVTSQAARDGILLLRRACKVKLASCLFLKFST